VEPDREAQLFAGETDRRVAAQAVAHALALLDEGYIAEARGLLVQALAEGGWPADPDGREAAEDERAASDAAESHEDEGAVLAEDDIAEAAADDRAELGGVADAELDSAFGAARPEIDAMIDADGIAFEAMRRARLDEPENVALPDPDSPFHTRTLADLLERQGDVEGAWAIRAALAEGEGDRALDEPAFPGHDSRAATLRTLERWLARLRGDDR
jgi:hypothetical protein